VRPTTCFAKTPGERFCLTGLLTIIAEYFRNRHGSVLPMATGVFTETVDAFVLADTTYPSGGGHGLLRFRLLPR
jgi:hypothetical protein